MERREFLASVGAAAAVATGAAALAGCNGDGEGGRRRRRVGAGEWQGLRRRFGLDPDTIHLAGMLLTSHPRDVADAIERHRNGLDANPADYVEGRNQELESAARSAAADYLGAGAGDVALVQSTTEAIALVYNGLDISAGQQMLTTTHDYYSTRESLRFKAQRTGADVVTVEPFANSATATADEIAGRIAAGVTSATRVVALTWVHSWTGIRIPIRRVADAIAQRAGAGNVLIGLDGVHALGVEDFDVTDLGCDFFMAGAHKWLFGPRGTGVLWGSPAAQDAVTPTIPTFSNETRWGGRMTPGGFKAFEHLWSLREAFELHGELGKANVTARIRELNTQCKEGLAAMDHVTLHTPMDPGLSSGIISFDVNGMSAQAVVNRLAGRNIVASVTPYDTPHARLSPGVLNTPEEIDETLAAVRDLA